MPRTRSDHVVWQSAEEPVHLDHLIDGGVGGFRPTPLDHEVLEFCLRCNYVTAPQAHRLGLSRSRARDRLYAFHRLGLMDRAWHIYRSYFDMAGLRQRRVGGWIYTLSALGFEYLLRTGSEYARQWAGDWQPRSHGEGSRKLSVGHELGRNDVLLGLLEAGERFDHAVVAWMGPRESRQYVPPRAPGARPVIIEPDGMLVLRTGRPVFIEYEQSGRRDRFMAKMLAHNRYVAASGWKEQGFKRRPWVVYAVASGGGTQRRASGSLGGLVEMARNIVTAEQHYLFIDETAWMVGDWQAINGEGRPVPFWETLLD